MHNRNLDRVLTLFSNSELLLVIDNLVDNFVSCWYPTFNRVAKVLHNQHSLSANVTISDMIAIQIQHCHLYPDGNIDSLPRFGISIIQENTISKADCESLIETLQKIQLKYKITKRPGFFTRLERNILFGRKKSFLSTSSESIDKIIDWFRSIFDMTDEPTELTIRSQKELCDRLENHILNICRLMNIDFSPVMMRAEEEDSVGRFGINVAPAYTATVTSTSIGSSGLPSIPTNSTNSTSGKLNVTVTTISSYIL